MMIGMALQIDQKPVGGGVGRVPRMVRLDVLVAPSADMAAGQRVVFDVVGELELPDRHPGLHHEEQKPHPAAKQDRQQQHGKLQREVFPERVADMAGRQSLARQLGLFRAQRR